MSRRYDGAVRSEYSIERRGAYHRARTRARHAVAVLHWNEYLQIVTPLRAAHRSDSREYKAAEAAAKREIARRYPDDFARLLDSHGRDDEHPDVTFLGPTAAHALVEALDHAARDAQTAFDGARTPAPGDQRPAAGLPPWGRAFTFGGLPYTLCPAGDGRVGPGQSAVAEAATGRIWHDDCAEAAGAYDHTQPPTSASAPSGLAHAGPGSGGADGAAVAGGHPPCLVPAAAPSTRRS